MHDEVKLLKEQPDGTFSETIAGGKPEGDGAALLVGAGGGYLHLEDRVAGENLVVGDIAVVPSTAADLTGTVLAGKKLSDIQNVSLVSVFSGDDANNRETDGKGMTLGAVLLNATDYLRFLNVDGTGEVNKFEFRTITTHALLFTTTLPVIGSNTVPYYLGVIAQDLFLYIGIDRANSRLIGIIGNWTGGSVTWGSAVELEAGVHPTNIFYSSNFSSYDSSFISSNQHRSRVEFLSNNHMVFHYWVSDSTDANQKRGKVALMSYAGTTLTLHQNTSLETALGTPVNTAQPRLEVQEFYQVDTDPNYQVVDLNSHYIAYSSTPSNSFKVFHKKDGLVNTYTLPANEVLVHAAYSPIRGFFSAVLLVRNTVSGTLKLAYNTTLTGAVTLDTNPNYVNSASYLNSQIVVRFTAVPPSFLPTRNTLSFASVAILRNDNAEVKIYVIPVTGTPENLTAFGAVSTSTIAGSGFFPNRFKLLVNPNGDTSTIGYLFLHDGTDYRVIKFNNTATISANVIQSSVDLLAIAGFGNFKIHQIGTDNYDYAIVLRDSTDDFHIFILNIGTNQLVLAHFIDSSVEMAYTVSDFAAMKFYEASYNHPYRSLIVQHTPVANTTALRYSIINLNLGGGIANKQTLLIPALIQSYSGTSTAYMQRDELVTHSTSYRAGEFWFGTIFHDVTATQSSIFSTAFKDCTLGLEGEIEEIGNFTSQVLDSTLPIQDGQVHLMLPVSSRFTVLIQQSGANIELNVFDNLTISSMVVQTGSFVGDYLSLFPFLDTQIGKMVIEENKFWMTYLVGSSIRCRVITVNNDATITIGTETTLVTSFTGTITSCQHNLYENFGEVFGVIAYQTSAAPATLYVVEGKFTVNNSLFAVVTSSTAGGLSFTSISTIVHQPIADVGSEGLGRVQIILKNSTQLVAVSYLANSGLNLRHLTVKSTQVSCFDGSPLKVYQDNQMTTLWFISSHGISQLDLAEGLWLSTNFSFLSAFAPNLILGNFTSFSPLYSSITEIRKPTDKVVVMTSSYSGTMQRAVLFNVPSNVPSNAIKTSEFDVTLGGTVFPDVGIDISSRLSGLLPKPNSTNYLLQIAFSNLNAVQTCYAAIEIQDSLGVGSLVLSSKYAEGTLGRIQNTDNCLLLKTTRNRIISKVVTINTGSSTMTLSDESDVSPFDPFFVPFSFQGIIKAESLIGGRFLLNVHSIYASTSSCIIKRASINSYPLSSYKWEQFNKLTEKTPLKISKIENLDNVVDGFLELINYKIISTPFGNVTSIRIDDSRIALYLSGSGLLFVMAYVEQDGTEGVLNLSEFSLPANSVIKKISQVSTPYYSPENFLMLEYIDISNTNAHGQNYFQTLLNVGAYNLTVTTQETEIAATPLDPTKLYKPIGGGTVVSIPPHHIPEPKVVTADFTELGFDGFENRSIESIMINDDILVSAEGLIDAGSKMVFRSVSKKEIVYVAGANELGFGSMYNVEPQALAALGDNLFAFLSSITNIIFIFEWLGNRVELKTVSEKLPTPLLGYYFSNAYKKPGTEVYYCSAYNYGHATSTVRIFKYDRTSNKITLDSTPSNMQGVTFPDITPFYAGATLDTYAPVKVLITDSVGDTIKGVLVRVSRFSKNTPPISRELYVRIKQFTINHLDAVPNPTETSPGVVDVTPYISPNNPAWKYQGNQINIESKLSANLYEIPSCHFYDYGLGGRFLSLFYVSKVVGGTGTVLSNDQGMNFALINLDTEVVSKYTDVVNTNEFTPIFGSTLSARVGYFKVYHIDGSKFLLSFVEGDYDFAKRLKRLYSKLFDLNIVFNTPYYEISVTPLSGSDIQGTILDLGDNGGEYVEVFEESLQLIPPNSLRNPNFNITSIIPLVHLWIRFEPGPMYSVYDNYYQAKLESIVEQITPVIPTPTMQAAVQGVVDTEKFSPSVGTNNLMLSNLNLMGFSVLPLLDTEFGLSTAKISIKDNAGTTVHNALMPLAANATDGSVLVTTAIPLVDNKFLIIFRHTSAPLVVKATVGTFTAPSTISYSTIFDIANLESGFSRFVMADIQTLEAVGNLSEYLFVFQEFSNTGPIRRTKTYYLTVDHSAPNITSEKISATINGENVGTGFNFAYQVGSTNIAQVPYPLTKLSPNKYVNWMGNRSGDNEANYANNAFMVRGVKGLNKTWRQFWVFRNNLIVPIPTSMYYLFVDILECRKSYVATGTDEQLTVFQNIQIDSQHEPHSVFVNQLSMRGMGINQVGYNFKKDHTMYLPVSVGVGVNAALMRIGSDMHFVYFSNNEILGSIRVSKSAALTNAPLFNLDNMIDTQSRNYTVAPKQMYPSSRTYLYKEYLISLVEGHFSNIIPDLSSLPNLESLPPLLSLGTSNFSTSNFSKLGIVTTGALANNTATYLRAGVYNGLSGLTAGRLYYADSLGNLTLTPIGKPIGLSLSSTSILLFFQTN